MNIFPKTFGLKHIISLVIAISLSAAVIIYSDYIHEFARYGYIGAFLIMFVSYATVVLPIPSLAIIFTLGSTYNPFLIGLLGGVGGTLGETIGYIAGIAGSDVVRQSKIYNKIEDKVSKYGFLAMFLLSVIPNPLFDLAGISAGALGIKWWKFMLAVGLGTIIKAVAVAYMGRYLFHEPFMNFRH